MQIKTHYLYLIIDTTSHPQGWLYIFTETRLGPFLKPRTTKGTPYTNYILIKLLHPQRFSHLSAGWGRGEGTPFCHLLVNLIIISPLDPQYYYADFFHPNYLCFKNIILKLQMKQLPSEFVNPKQADRKETV